MNPWISLTVMVLAAVAVFYRIRLEKKSLTCRQRIVDDLEKACDENTQAMSDFTIELEKLEKEINKRKK